MYGFGVWIAGDVIGCIPVQPVVASQEFVVKALTGYGS